MVDDDANFPLLQFGPCRWRGLRKRDGLPLCQHERPHIHSFLRVQRCDRAGLFASLTWKCRRKTVPFRVKRGKAALMFRVSSTLRTSSCQQWLLHHPRGGNILVESVGQTVVTLRFRWRMNREVKVIMSRMSGRRWASVKATTSMRVCALRRNLEEKMDGLTRLEKGRVQYTTEAGRLLCLKGSATVSSLLKKYDGP